MKKFTATILTMFMVISILTGCASEAVSVPKETQPEEDITTAEETQEPIELIILAAASLTDVTEELSKRYKEIAPNIILTFSYGASGALQTQIEEGAPADIFMSASSKQMNALEEGGLLLSDTRKDLLVNKVVLIVPQDSTLVLTSFGDVADDTVKTIALGEPEGVPVGQYSEQVFTSLGILDIVKAKANYGSDVRQVLTWVESGEVDCGVVYSTDAKISEKISIVCEAPEDSHEEVVYPVAAIEGSLYPDEAKAFLAFLSSDEAKDFFEEFGFNLK